MIAQHNCVIMPGIGAFLAHRVPAYYSAADKVFMPPHRELGFNPQVTVDDALLLSEYMNDSLLSYEEASRCLKSDIDSLRSRLADNGVVCFGELGTFEMDIEGKISFTPNENCIDDPQNYGFEPLLIAPLKELKKKAEETHGYIHKCAVCGVTDADSPDLEFRYCSKCDGYYCYCMDHINNHAHVKQ